ncbi:MULTISPECIES: TauD/TfdA dioxygenase family protein [Pseudomonas]|uniref:TauD/TfdA family dioxygenase n=1 Tax=Pseudomonas eucalypticola TaxID=2599595 RepID=A0A7D5H8L4_9PSED|nr:MULTISPECIES: TauD/TfdA family dioxygenase [Pseudomonas]QKZ05804.1 TauD/TfdA family dioxygenase [Pseudomonas eucalypticola]
MSLNVEPIHPLLGARVAGLDLADVDDATLARIEAALVQHKVLFFADQHWSAAQQKAFAERLGELHVHPVFEADPAVRELVVFAYDDKRKGANDTWHADVTFAERPLKLGILHAEEIPALGGDTLWVDTEAAYNALSEPLKALFGTLSAVHDFQHARHPDDALSVDELADLRRLLPKPTLHPVIRTHPVSGRKSIYVNRAFTSHIAGLSRLESEQLLNLLLQHLQIPEFQMRWRWQTNTVAIWDNRSTQHLAVADYFPARRRVRRAAVLEEARPV